MQYVTDVILILLVIAVFGYVHSLLASIKVKEFIKENLGNGIAFYRLAYNLFALASLYFIWEVAPHPSLLIYELNPPFDFLVFIPQVLGLIGFFWTFNYICFKEFIGIDQVIRYFEGTYSKEELDEHLTLRIEGPYRYSRHPLYFFSILILTFRAEMDLFYLTLLVSFVAYFYIGSVYEEKKLTEYFGQEYIRYKKQVPRILPLKIIKPYKR